MDALNFNLIFTGLFVGMLVFGFLFGYLKGFKKSLFNLIVMAIFFTVFFLTINTVAKFLYSTPIPGLGGFLESYMAELKDANSLKEIFSTLINNALKDQLNGVIANDELNAFIASVSMFAIKIIYAILYFTVVYLLYRFIFMLISMIFVRNKKELGKSKHRLIGAGIGVLHSAMTVFVLMIFLGGIMSMAKSANTFLPEEYQIPEATQVVEAYFDNPLVHYANKVVITQDSQKTILTNYLFDDLFSIQYRGQNIALRHELEIGSDIYTIYLDSTYYETKNISDITGDDVRLVFQKLSESDLIITAIPLGVEVGANYYNETVVLPQDDLYSIDWSTELMQLGEVSAIIFDVIHNAGLIDGGADLTTTTLNGDDVRSLFDALSESQLVNLAAYNALEPILIEAGSGLNAIITVPDGLVWEDEFQAIGAVAGEIVDTGITVNDLQSGDPSVILTSLSQLDFTVILDSKIMSQALINILTGAADIQGLDTFVVPDDIVWYDEYNEQGDLVQAGELRNILVAVNAIAQVASEINFSSIDFNVISDFNDDTVDAIFDSRILVATVSNLVADMDLGGNAIILSDSIYDSDHYIKKDELKALVNSARVIVVNLACAENETCDASGFNISKAFTLSDESIDILLTSQILSDTIGNLIIDSAGDVLTIPTADLTTIQVATLPMNVVSADEIKALFKAVSALGLTDINNFSFDASILHNLAIETDVTVLDNDKADTLFASDIIHATLSKMLIDLTTGVDSVLVVPTLDVNSQPVLYTDEVDYISTGELKAIMSAVLKLNLTDFNDVQHLDIFGSNVSTLLDSAILHATISKQLFDLGSTFLLIPTAQANGDPTEIVVSGIHFIDKSEIIHLVDAIEVLGITDITTINGVFDFNLLNSDAAQNTLLSSASIHATISQKLLDLSSGILIVPMKSQDGSIDIKTSMTYINSINPSYLIDKGEIKALINAFLKMNYTNLDNFQTSIATTEFFSYRSDLLQSSSIQATISDKIINQTSGNLIVPDKNVATNEDVLIVMPDVTYVSLSEINALLDGLEELGFQDFSTINFVPDNVFNLDFNVLLDSASIQATLSDLILNSASDEGVGTGTMTLIVPTYFREAITVSGNPETQIEKSELNALLMSLQTLGVEDFSGNMDASLITGLTNQQLNTMLTSGSVHITIDNMLKGNANILEIPDLAKVDVYNLVGVTSQTELVNFIAAANAITAGSFTNVSFDLSAVIGMTSEQRNTVLDSMIVRNAITPSLETMVTSDPFYSIDNTFYENHDINTFLTEQGINTILTHYGLI